MIVVLEIDKLVNVSIFPSILLKLYNVPKVLIKYKTHLLKKTMKAQAK
jgi:hypothetical protein